MKKTLQIGTLTLALMTCLLSGCAWSVGGERGGMNPTRGQELVDLKRAKDAGALTEEEYQAQKRKVIER
jgi:hypothetical protein